MWSTVSQILHWCLVEWCDLRACNIISTAISFRSAFGADVPVYICAWEVPHLIAQSKGLPALLLEFLASAGVNFACCELPPRKSSGPWSHSKIRSSSRVFALPCALSGGFPGPNGSCPPCPPSPCSSLPGSNSRQPLTDLCSTDNEPLCPAWLHSYCSGDDLPQALRLYGFRIP